jgi:hypothetical protein
MIPVGAEWNPQHGRLKELLKQKDTAEKGYALCLTMHGMLHDKGVTAGFKGKTYSDHLWKYYDEERFRITNSKDWSVVWNLWHMTRVEDLVSSLLLGNREPVLRDSWLVKLGTDIRDTGNAMTSKEIVEFSRVIDIKELREYRMVVGRMTQNILKSLKPEDLNMKPGVKQLDRIIETGGVIDHPDSLWLRTFWGRKTTAGLLLMPLTRHLVVHLNHCFKIVEKRNI